MAKLVYDVEVNFKTGGIEKAVQKSSSVSSKTEDAGEKSDKNWQKTTAALDKIPKSWEQAIDVVLGGLISDVVSSLGTIVKTLLSISVIGTFIVGAIMMLSVISKGFESAFKGVQGVLDIISTLISAMVMPFVNLLIPLLIPLLYILTPFVKMLNLLLTPLLILMMKVYSTLGKVQGEAMTALLTGDFSGFISKVFEALTIVFDEIIVPLATALWNALTGMDWAGIVSGFITAIINAIPAIQSFLEGIWEGVKDIEIGGLSIGDWVSNAMDEFDKIKTTLLGIWEFVTELFGEGDNPLVTFFTDAIDTISDFVDTKFNTIIQNIIKFLQTLTNWVGTVFNAQFYAVWVEVLDNITDIITSTFDGIVKFVGEGLITLVGMLETFVNKIIDSYNKFAGSVGMSDIENVDFSGATKGIQSGIKGFMDTTSAERFKSGQALGVARENAQTAVNSFTFTVQGDVTGENLKKEISDYMNNLMRNQNIMIGV